LRAAGARDTVAKKGERMRYRGVWFCVLLALPWIPCISILVQFSDVLGLGEWSPGKLFAVVIAKSAPEIAKDTALFGELTPVAVAAAVMLLAPDKTQPRLIYAAVAICAIGWVLYLTLTVLIAPPPGPFYDALVTRTEGDISNDGLATLKGFITGTRMFYLVVGATLLGFQMRKDAG
jgi:hypothetical protein